MGGRAGVRVGVESHAGTMSMTMMKVERKMANVQDKQRSSIKKKASPISSDAPSIQQTPNLLHYSQIIAVMAVMAAQCVSPRHKQPTSVE